MKFDGVSRIVYRLFRPFASQTGKSFESAMVETHTGQKFEKSDYRSARFMESEKLVNKQFAVKLVNEVPPMKVTGRVATCSGGHGALGHPKVYINLDQPGLHACGYCGLRFEQADEH